MITARYDYPNPRGEPRIRKLRFEPGRRGATKSFRMEHWGLATVTGGYKWKRGKGNRLVFAERAMYRLPELLRALKAGRPVVWTEGEKDADAVADATGYATTSHWQAAGNATPGQAAWFSGTRSQVYLVADVDLPGAYCVMVRLALLAAVGVSAVVLAPPRGYGDAAEALSAGRSWAKFRRPSLRRVEAASARYAQERAAGRASYGRPS